MKKTALCLLAAVATSPFSRASGTEEWLGLEKELQSFRSEATPRDRREGLSVSGFVRSGFVLSSGADIAGFSIDNVRLSLSASVEDVDIVVQFDAGARQDPNSNWLVSSVAGPPFGLAPFGGSTIGEGVLDAYGSWNVTDQVTLTAGQFRRALLHFARNTDEDSTFFTGRSVNEARASARDQGIEVRGRFDRFGFWGGVQNGSDTVADRLAVYGRVQFASSEEVGRVQGAMGSSENIQFLVGAAVYDDDALTDGTAWAVDAAATMGMFALWGDVVGYGKSLTAGGSRETTYSIAGSIMFVPDTWEVGVRWEGLQDVFGPGTNDNLVTIGLNYYLAGHGAKVQADYSILSTDIPGDDTETLTIGTTLGW